jgi:hypothetical protein
MPSHIRLSSDAVGGTHHLNAHSAISITLASLFGRAPRSRHNSYLIQIDRWFERTAEEFVTHLIRERNADNRYVIYGYFMRTQDLHMLDQMVFAVRRLMLT